MKELYIPLGYKAKNIKSEKNDMFNGELLTFILLFSVFYPEYQPMP